MTKNKKPEDEDPKYNRKKGDTLEGWQVFAAFCIVGVMSWLWLFGII